MLEMDHSAWDPQYATLAMPKLLRLCQLQQCSYAWLS